MRKITRDAINAFNSNYNFSQSNTSVTHEDGVARLFLHGNCIATKDVDGTLTVTNCGWQSKTTKERLNGLVRVSIHQSKGVWYLNGEVWDGSEKVVSVPVTVASSTPPNP